MARPRKMRSVNRPPQFKAFKPAGIRSRFLEDLPLELDELEAIRLADHEGLDHNESAERMGISRSTFSPLVEKARHKVACFLIEGNCLTIEGGDVHFRGNLIRCEDCGSLTKLPFTDTASVCSDCGSANLTDLAGCFGHGGCCRRHHGNRRG